MDVHIGRVDATVHAVDDDALLTPDLLDRIAAEVRRRLAADRDRTARDDEETRLRAGVTPAPDPVRGWER
jgi:hypothetical protein